MRRPVLYIAGLMLATGASFAFAGTANAAASGGPFGDEYDISSSYEVDYEYSDNNDEYNQFSLLNVLSPNGQDNTGLNLGLFGR
ncbi:hypothetical protein [Paractinoplanes maris]|uniref:hypothetical protein n=1 Tax=Paractinoplanes maris TaxID=1734446 RepID=UPI002021D66B|nr:hypothetical protein [Actinoplanes maris]